MEKGVGPREMNLKKSVACYFKIPIFRKDLLLSSSLYFSAVNLEAAGFFGI
jgi:hypothetical protein